MFFKIKKIKIDKNRKPEHKYMYEHSFYEYNTAKNKILLFSELNPKNEEIPELINIVIKHLTGLIALDFPEKPIFDAKLKDFESKKKEKTKNEIQMLLNKRKMYVKEILSEIEKYKNILLKNFNQENVHYTHIIPRELEQYNKENEKIERIIA